MVKEIEEVFGVKVKRRGSKLSNLKVMDYIVFISIFSIIGFTAISLYYYYRHGIPVSEIKTELFYFFGAELLGMAAISISSNLSKKGTGDNNEG